MWWWIVGVVVVALVVWMSWRFSLTGRLDKSSHGGAGPDAEAAEAARAVMRDIDRGRAAGGGMFPG